MAEGEKIEIRESRILLEDSFRPPNDRLMVSEDPYGLDPNAFKEVNEVVVRLMSLVSLDFFDNQFLERQQTR